MGMELEGHWDDAQSSTRPSEVNQAIERFWSTYEDDKLPLTPIVAELTKIADQATQDEQIALREAANALPQELADQLLAKIDPPAAANQADVAPN